MFFFSGCTEDSQCTDDAKKGVCDITKNECVSKLHQSMLIIRFGMIRVGQANSYSI